MKTIINQAILKYEEKTILSNIVKVNVTEISDGCPCIFSTVRAVAAVEDTTEYTYTLSSERQTKDDPP